MDPERYWQHSPLKYAEHCHTPTLFIHAENDYRCPVSEGISMFQALKFKGIEARLCIFKGNPRIEPQWKAEKQDQASERNDELV